MLKDRVEQARATVRAGLVISKDGTEYNVPCSRKPGQYHRVWLRRKGRVVWATCAETVVPSAGFDGSVPCPGNRNGTVCRHALAAAVKRAADMKVSVCFCGTEAAARRLARLGGQVVALTGEGWGAVWAVIERK